MKLLNRIIDTLQALFPPNRLVVLFAGATTALAGIASAWLAAHFPGLALGTTEIAIVLSAVLLIGARLFDKWLDQWQRGEPIDLNDDLDQAFVELLDDDDVRKVIGEKFPEFLGVEAQPVAVASSTPAPAAPAAPPTT